MSGAQLEADEELGWANVQICFANVYANTRKHIRSWREFGEKWEKLKES